MKINGRKVEKCIEYVVLPREGGDIVFTCTAVTDYADFDKLCPIPVAPIKVMKGGAKVPDLEDVHYRSALQAYASKKSEWMFLTSLRATDIEWDTVDYVDSNTWKNWESDLKNAGFSDVEMQRIFKGVVDANCLNEDRLKEARERFLAGQRKESDSSSFRQPEQASTPSGEAVNASA